MLRQVIRTGNKNEIMSAIQTLTEDVNAVDRFNMTPLMLLSSRKYIKLESAQELIGALIEKGADVDYQVKEGCTALYYAIEERSYHAVVALLEHRPRTDYLVDMSYTIVHKAVLCRQPEIFKVVFDYCSMEVLRLRDLLTGNTFLHELVEQRHAFKSVLAHVITSDKCERVLEVCDGNNQTPLMKAALQRRRSGPLIMLLYAHTDRLTRTLSVDDHGSDLKFLMAQAIVRRETTKSSPQ